VHDAPAWAAVRSEARKIDGHSFAPRLGRALPGLATLRLLPIRFAKMGRHFVSFRG
jgi:hypothetical protein